MYMYRNDVIPWCVSYHKTQAVSIHFVYCMEMTRSLYIRLFLLRFLFLQYAVTVAVYEVNQQSQYGPAGKEDERMGRQFRENEGTTDEPQGSDDVHGRAAESARFVGIGTAQDEDAHTGAKEGKNRASAACFRYDVYGRKSRNAGYDNTDDDLNDIGRMEFRMHFIEAHGHESVTAHGIESAALGKEHTQDDRGKTADGARTYDS